MAWTYDATKFDDATAGTYGSTIGDRYQVRLLIQDTQTSRPLLQDEEIDWLLTQESNVYRAAARCCDSLVARGGSIGSKTVGDLSIAYNVEFYRGLAADLRARGQGDQTPMVGGLSVNEKITDRADADAIQPAFARGLHDDIGAPGPSFVPPNHPLVQP